MRRLALITLCASLGMHLVACEEVSQFSTGSGECWSGGIVAADFVRLGFAGDVRATLTLNTRELPRGEPAGELTTSDGRFLAATVRQMVPIAHDKLSLVQFPGGRIRNYIAYATPTSGATATAVISLMEDGSLELRILRPPCAESPGPDGGSEYTDDCVPLFGLFQLTLREECR